MKKLGVLWHLLRSIHQDWNVLTRKLLTHNMFDESISQFFLLQNIPSCMWMVQDEAINTSDKLPNCFHNENFIINTDRFIRLQDKMGSLHQEDRCWMLEQHKALVSTTDKHAMRKRNVYKVHFQHTWAGNCWCNWAITKGAGIVSLCLLIL